MAQPITVRHTEDNTGAWSSLMLRLAIASLFLGAVVPKLTHGIEGIRGVVGYFSSTFEKTWLPLPMVRGMAWANPFIEALIVIWLVVGYRLKVAWIFTTAFIISLGFGMIVAGKPDFAAHNYIYILIACTGLYMSRYDRFSADGLRQPH
jgi:uncharacterized membrane protein YphA (DoxX/SURF4 family)